ncbi:right-handed parallel beta-helix repeat-containing protein [Listeria weihenstephanensis]|uniref:Right-handed parallel beta-helix repeat-containing protein n=1 Tax=Listeria weihenstephanensis TaxID=1006155 RepID=A0A841Z351_9LIST|nr:immunoglobulin-like domain-containing protein [Listeria weihenstephanensis]MBC1499710.1 right-handed parallel beta-helix repeat-containing protein [Listeria weihenstephanensis]
MKKSLVASIIVAASLIFMYLHANPIHAQAANEVDLKPLIEQAGSGTLVLKDKKDVTYIVNAPITNVKCSIQGAPGGSYIKANFKGYGNTQTPYLLTYQTGIANKSVKNVTFNLALIGRGAIHFEQNNAITVENSAFTGYSKQYGYYKTDSSISFTDSQNIVIKNNRFFDNGYQYGRDTNDLNRAVTIQGNKGNQYEISGNEFTRVNQAIVVQGDRINKLNIHNNAFNSVVDNSMYLLKIPTANIYNNDFNKGQKTSSADEGIVLDGGYFKITNNRVYNVLNKFIAINGNTVRVDITFNHIKNEKTKTRPAVIAWRNNRDYAVGQLNLSNNWIDTDTAPANYDVIPIGKVAKLAIQNNQITLNGLANYQKILSLLGGAPVDSLAITGNNITPRKGSTLSKNAFFLREPLPKIKQLALVGNHFLGRYPAILNTLKGSVTPNTYRNKSAYMTGRYTGTAVKARLIINGIPKGWGGKFEKGIFVYYVGAKTNFKLTDKVELIAYNANNKQLDRKRLKIIK